MEYCVKTGMLFWAIVSWLTMGMNAVAQSTYFNDSGGDHLWSNAANWNNGVPVSTNDAHQIDAVATSLILDSTAVAASFVNGNNSASTFILASGGDLTTGGRFDIGNSDSVGIGMLQVNGGSLNVGGQFQLGRYGPRTGMATLNSGSIRVGDLTHIGGWNSGTGDLIINGGTFTADSHMNIGLNGAGTVTVNGGSLLVTNAWKSLHVSPNGADGLLVINGGTVMVDTLKTDGNTVGTPRIEVDGGLLKINRSGDAGFNIANDDTEFFIGNGTVVQSGNSIDGFTNAIASGLITWSGIGTNMLTDEWDFSFTNETDSLLFVDYNDANPGSTTMWVYEPNGGSTSNESTLVSNDGVLVYTNVPGLAPSEFYSFRVRAVGSTNWLSPFAFVTRCIPDTPDNRENTRYYCRWLGDWSNTYINFELSNNVPVEIEISKVGGAPITHAVPHPRRKAKSWRIEDRKAYIVLDKPSLIAVDIDGQMDTQNTAKVVDGPWGDDNTFYNGPPIHTVTIFANPVIDKPDINDPSVYVVEPGEMPPETGSWSTLYFKPGIHQLFTGNRLDTYYEGCDFQLKSGKSYYIPGDAIVYGHMNTYDNDEADIQTENTRVYGYGTISGARSSHPEHMTVPYDEMTPEGKRIRSLAITEASGCTLEGVTMADAANHTCKLDTKWQQYVDFADINYAKWLKVFTWRGNGDGISTAGNGYLENCFLRTQDDGTYPSGLGISNVVYWSDVNGMALRCDVITNKRKAGNPTWLPEKFIIEDIDIIYARCVFGNGTRSVIGRPSGQNFQILPNGETNTAQHMVFRNINFEDPIPTRRFLALVDSDTIGEGDLAGIRFENVRVAANEAVFGTTNALLGHDAPEVRSHVRNLIFDNFVVAGEQVDQLEDFEHNEYAYDMIFSNAAPETMTFLNTSGYGKWYVYDDWDTGVEPARHDTVKHTAVAETLTIDAMAYAGDLMVSHAGTATVAVVTGGDLIVSNTVELGSNPSLVGILELHGGVMQVEGDFIMNEGSRIELEAGVVRWKGNRISDVTALVANNYIHWSSGQTNMLTESWDAGWTNGNSVLYADYDTVSNGYTTVWAFDLNPGASGYDLFAEQFILVEGPEGDDDHDGLANLAEFGLGGNPTNSGHQGYLPMFGKYDGELRYTHAQRSGLQYYLELTDNLVSNIWKSEGYTILGTNDTVGEFNFVTNTVPAVEPQQFLRLRIDLQ